MVQHGSGQCGMSMKAIVKTLANDKVKKFYEKNKHSALGDAAEESEIEFISAPRDTKQHTKWCRSNGFTKTIMPYFHSKVSNFFSQSSMNNYERPSSWTS